MIAGGNLCHGNNINNNVLANDELIFIGHTSSCASLHECHTIICPNPVSSSIKYQVLLGWCTLVEGAQWVGRSTLTGAHFGPCVWSGL